MNTSNAQSAKKSLGMTQRKLERLQKDLEGIFKTYFQHNFIVHYHSQNSGIETIQNGLGIKFGMIFQCLSMFVGGWIVGFTNGWRLAIIILAVMPFIVITGISFLINLN